MKRIKVLGNVLKRTRADKIIIGFIVFIFAIAANRKKNILPEISKIHNYRNWRTFLEIFSNSSLESSGSLSS